MAETHWTPLMVEERLVEAADVMRRLPDVRVPGHFNTWPKILTSSPTSSARRRHGSSARRRHPTRSAAWRRRSRGSRGLNRWTARSFGFARPENDGKPSAGL